MLEEYTYDFGPFWTVTSDNGWLTLHLSSSGDGLLASYRAQCPLLSSRMASELPTFRKWIRSAPSASVADAANGVASIVATMTRRTTASRSLCPHRLLRYVSASHTDNDLPPTTTPFSIAPPLRIPRGNTSNFLIRLPRRLHPKGIPRPPTACVAVLLAAC